MLDDYSGLLSEYEAKQVLADAGIPVVTETLATSADEAVAAANDLGYPVVLKADSADIQHKTDIGAVMDAHDADEVRSRYDLIVGTVHEALPDAELDGVLVEQHLSGQEMIVGVHRDPDFGHVLMFGLGGVFVEVLHDVNFRVVPITPWDAHELMHDLRSEELLDGVRGQPPADREAIVDVLFRVSTLVKRHPEIVELDINPLFVNEDGAVAADALMRVESE